MNDLTDLILYALEDSGRTLAEFLRALDDAEGEAFSFLTTLIDEVILPFEEE